MKRLWRRKWFFMALTLAVFLSVGAVAWAAGTGEEQAAIEGQEVLIATGRSDRLTREALEERRELRIQRQKALMQLVRDEMTAEDQAVYDRLVQTVKEQREALAEARRALKSTLEELRDLTDKYLENEQSAAPGAKTAFN